jgi:hypothetical protein
MTTAKLLILFAALLEPYDLPMPEVIWEDDLKQGVQEGLGLTSCIGKPGATKYRKCWIVLNKCIAGTPRLLGRTARHELAHYIVAMTTHTVEHDKEWYRVAKEIGLKRPNKLVWSRELKRRCHNAHG